MKLILAKGSFPCTKSWRGGDQRLEPQFDTQELELSLAQPSRRVTQFRSASDLAFHPHLASFCPNRLRFLSIKAAVQITYFILQAVMRAPICGAVSGLL